MSILQQDEAKIKEYSLKFGPTSYQLLTSILLARSWKRFDSNTVIHNNINMYINIYIYIYVSHEPWAISCFFFAFAFLSVKSDFFFRELDQKEMEEIQRAALERMSEITDLLQVSSHNRFFKFFFSVSSNCVDLLRLMIYISECTELLVVTPQNKWFNARNKSHSWFDTTECVWHNTSLLSSQYQPTSTTNKHVPFPLIFFSSLYLTFSSFFLHFLMPCFLLSIDPGLKTLWKNFLSTLIVNLKLYFLSASIWLSAVLFSD
jgi:hypothetical protein